MFAHQILNVLSKFLHSTSINDDPELNPVTINLHFSGNNATQQGSNLFGGLVDKCIPRQPSEVYRKNRTY